LLPRVYSLTFNGKGNQEMKKYRTPGGEDEERREKKVEDNRCNLSENTNT
jgi:hypothetical protein